MYAVCLIILCIVMLQESLASVRQIDPAYVERELGAVAAEMVDGKVIFIMVPVNR